MASVAKFRLNEAPRLLTHCSRTQKTPGSHIHKERTCLNFNMAEGRHQGFSDYEFVKNRIHQDGVKMLNREDVKAVCSWAITMPRELCHEEIDSEGETFYVPNEQEECEEFFHHAYNFFKEKHGEDNIISAYVHMDENVPHMHFIFVPIVKDGKDPNMLKVCAKEALHDCYSAKFQIELQDYMSEHMGKELNMVKKDTVDYERNVKELKKKTLNERCAYLAKQISISEEEIKRKQRIVALSEKRAAAEADIDNIKTTTSNGYTLINTVDWLKIKPLIRSVNAMKAERAELLNIIKEFENTNVTKENIDLKSQAEKLSKENEQLEGELNKLKYFMETTEIEGGYSLMEAYEMNQKKMEEADRQAREKMYDSYIGEAEK